MPNSSWFKQAILYQIFTGRWEESHRTQNETTFEWFKHQQWQHLLEHGINTIYLLGLFEHNGPILVNNEHSLLLESATYPRVSSLFALTNHTVINSQFGNIGQLKELVAELKKRGFHVIVDFVPNHTATSHPWVTQHPDYYVRANGNFVAEFSGDVYKLDYSNPSLRKEMLGILQWILNLGVDGVRCDMAHLIPADFWQWAIEKIRNLHQEFIFVAEAYPNSLFDYSNIQSLYTVGFDAVYNNGLYDNVIKVIVEHQPIDYLAEYLKAQPVNHPGLTLNYFFNHDDPPLKNWKQDEQLLRLSEQFFEALLGLTLFTPGVPFLYNGSLCGLTHRLGHHWLEPLQTKYQELCVPMTNSVAEMLNIRWRYCDEIVGGKYEITSTNQLLTLSAKSFIFIVNLTESSQVISINEKTIGLLHSLQAHDSILPGQAEIWKR